MKTHPRPKELCWLLALGLAMGTPIMRAQDAEESEANKPDAPAMGQSVAGESREAAAKAEDEETSTPKEETTTTWPQEIVRVGSDVILREGEEAAQLVVVFGSAQMDGKVHGDVVVVCGKAKVNGLVEGNLVVPLGSLQLGPKAHVRGDTVVIGGAIDADSAAKVDGDRMELTWAMVEQKVPLIGGIKNWLVKGLLWGRPLPHQAGWWWWVALVSALIYLATGLLFSRPIAASVAALESQPVGSFFAGVLGYILICVLFLLLLVTGVGILIVPFLCCGAAVAYLFGKAAVCQCVGQQLGKQTGLAALQLPFVGLVLGVVILYLLYMVPFLGFLVWGLAGTLGLGAVLMAAVRAQRSERGSRSGSSVGGSPPADGYAPAAAPTLATPPIISTTQASSPPSSAEVCSLPRAGFWIRFAATFIDLLLVGAILSIVGLHGPLFLVLWAVYHVGMWAWKGTTIGGVVFGLKVVRRDGHPVDFPIALVRSLSSFLSALVLFVGFFWAGWTRERAAWHDLIAGTMIVKVPKGVPLL